MEKTKILVIDDEVGFTKMLRLNLEQTGMYEVMEENISANAIESIRNFRPALILLDVFMPEVSGDMIAQEIYNDEDLKNTKIVFLTALVTEAELAKLSNQDNKKAQGAKIAAQTFIAKPVKFDELITCIKEELGD